MGLVDWLAALLTLNLKAIFAVARYFRIDSFQASEWRLIFELVKVKRITFLFIGE